MSETLPTVEFMVGANFLGSNSGVSRATKKVHTRPNLSPESKDLTVDGNGQKIQGSELPNTLYKYTLIGASSDPAHIMKPLMSNVRINGRLQRVEYESLLDVCFRCGHYGHRVDLCMGVKILSPNKETWPQRAKGCFSGATRREDFRSGYGGSRFAAFQGDEGEI
ncbi:hypothetical protein Gorai_021438, partial [Gossypium raimondii]|nr:hypothetical protein [Gossypium raimondii]